jgi:hypothetical protein
MRALVCCLAAAAVLTVAVPAASAQTTTVPPLEDVTLRGRVLGADGKPVANAHVRVNAIHDTTTAAIGFFATLGFGLLTCFAAPADSELCAVPNSKEFKANTDANGRYSFTFKNAHRRGQQTNTDYVFSIGVPSRAHSGAVVVASYELELQDAVHDAPDLRIWDPDVRLTPRARAYGVDYRRRPDSKNGGQILIGDKPSGLAVPDSREIDARLVEDQTFSVLANAAKDVTAAGTIYHQRFIAAPVTRKGELVPLSRNAPCTATRADGTAAHCGYTDGDLVTAGVVDPNPCAFPTDRNCQSAVTTVTVDLGAAKEVGDIRTRCTCQLEGSTDATAWHGLPSSGTFGKQSLRYVRVTGASLAAIPEISVWPPWPDTGRSIGLLPGFGGRGSGGDDAATPWGLALVALGALAVAGGLWLRRRRGDDVAEVRRPL